MLHTQNDILISHYSVGLKTGSESLTLQNSVRKMENITHNFFIFTTITLNSDKVYLYCWTVHFIVYLINTPTNVHIFIY